MYFFVATSHIIAAVTLMVFAILDLPRCNASLTSSEGLRFTKFVSQQISKRLTDITRSITHYDKIQEDFQNIFNASGISITNVNGADLNQVFTSNVDALFRKKKNDLKNVKVRAEELKANRTLGVKDLTKVQYINVKDADENNTVQVPSFSKSVRINLNQSFVQVPTNIYSRSMEILEAARWTERLDELFVANFDNQADPTMLYQYYCDATGLLRIYPGNSNGYRKDPNNPDLYDCRHRLWYIQVSSSPKDVVMIIDTSGSMSGTNIAIARIAVTSLIDTLQENDFFNILLVNKQVHYLIQSCTYLLQATKTNKEMMKKALFKIESPYGIQDMDLAIEEAFTALEKGTFGNRTSANCNKVIMVLSDGVEGSYAGRAVFERRNKDGAVKAFGFLIGSKSNADKTALKKMACSNGGDFYEIPTLGNIWDTVLEYIEVLSRPLWRGDDTQIINFTPIYLDSTGLGMILSVSSALFNNKRLIGVAGVDVLLKSLDELIPKEKLGVFSHTFAINNNGFVILHPYFREQNGYLPIPPNVYIDDIERPIEKQSINNLTISMIDQLSGSLTIPSYWIYDENKRLHVGKNTYFFSPIPDTDFSAATAIFDTDVYTIEIADQTFGNFIKQGKNAMQNQKECSCNQPNQTQCIFQAVRISRWNFCNITANASKHHSKSIKLYPESHEILTYLENVTSSMEIPSDCDVNLIKNLFTTAGVSNKYSVNNCSMFYEKQSVLSSTEQFLDALFVLTKGGYSKYITSKGSKIFDRDVLKQGIFELASASPTVPIFVSPFTKSPQKTTVIAGAARLNANGNNMLLAVSGMEVSSQFTYNIFANATDNASKIISQNINCSRNEDFICALIDFHSYVVTSNQGDNQNGRLLNELMGLLGEDLVKENLFTKVILDDTQAECPVGDDKKSSANILLTPAKILFAFFKYFLSSSYWLLLNIFLLTTAFFREYVASSQNSSRMNVSCVKEMTFFNINDTRWNEVKETGIFRTVNCSKTCSQNYSLSAVPGTNLIFLVASIPCQECKVNGMHLSRSKEKYEDICKTNNKYRRKPSNCFSKTNNETAYKCKGITTTPSILAHTLFASISILIPLLKWS